MKVNTLKLIMQENNLIKPTYYQKIVIKSLNY